MHQVYVGLCVIPVSQVKNACYCLLGDFFFLTWANWYFMAYLVHGHGNYRVIVRINIRIRDRDLVRFV